jgi:DNA-binding LacI/PurR family transcriptional regulator
MTGKVVRIKNIGELAKLAGVSTSTVSRALDDSPLIAQKTRTRIQALAREYDFRPNIMARNLRIQRTGAIGVVIPLGHETGQHISDPFFITMLGFLADALTERGHDLMLSRVVPSDDEWLDKIVDSGRVDGLIIIGQSNQSATIDRVAGRYRNMVVWGGYTQGQVHCSVGTDNIRGGYLATHHLISRGCQNVTFMGDHNILEMSQRYQGYQDAMREAGFEANISELTAHLVAETAHPEITKFLGENAHPPQGIFAATDVIAMSALRALSDFGLAVPSDVKVVGYDGLTISEHTVPRLSTVKQDLAVGAEHMIDLLFRRIAGEDTDSVVIEPELLHRMSS